ncbi:MAG: glycoside hydrolase family 13 protein, partial [Chlorobia bacterium]|nr:glycoside hydrolase family 13 protein [Fimbriimonadaceae bacterium]
MILGTLLAMTLSPNLGPETFQARAKDWRIGPVIYQVFVDRFFPPRNPIAKAKFFTGPRKLRNWDELPKGGTFLPEVGLWSHELEFWGGDLPGVQSKLGYISKLGADVLYLTPIHQALTNHRYDAQDYLKVAPEFGTGKDLDRLISGTHGAKMRIVLDGVFNHVGRTSDLFQQASKNPKSPRRDWFYFGKEYKTGYRAWAGVGNLPALNLESRRVQDYIWRSKNSVVRHYLNRGIDGWRL